MCAFLVFLFKDVDFPQVAVSALLHLCKKEKTQKWEFIWNKWFKETMLCKFIEVTV